MTNTSRLDYSAFFPKTFQVSATARYEFNSTSSKVSPPANTTDDDGLIGGHTIPQVVVIGIVAVALMVLTIGGNILVILSYRYNRRLRTINNMFLVSLACSDFVIGCVSMTLYPIYMITRKWYLGRVMCDIWLCIDYTLSMASVANLMLICFDRYLSITRPFTYRKRRTRSKTRMFIILAWLLSFLMWTPAIVIWPIVKGRTVLDDECVIQFLKEEKSITLGTAILAFYLPVSIMCILYGLIYKETKKCSQYLEYLKNYRKSRSVSSPFLNFRRPFQRSSSPSSSPRLGMDSRADKTEMRPRFLSMDQGKQSLSIVRPRVGSLAERKPLPDHKTLDKLHSRTRTSSSASHLSISPLACGHDTATNSKQKGSISETESVISNTCANNNKKQCEKRSSGKFLFSFSKKLNISKAPKQEYNTSTGSSWRELDAPLISKAPPTRSRSVPASMRSSLLNSETEMNAGPSNSNANQANATSKHAKFKNGLRKKHNERIETKSRVKLPSSERKAGRTLSAILLAFLLTWLPYDICVVVMTFCTAEGGCVPTPVWDAAYYLCYINSTVNPFCFALCNKTFRETFKQILTCTWRGNYSFNAPRPVKNKGATNQNLALHPSSSSSTREQ